MQNLSVNQARSRKLQQQAGGTNFKPALRQVKKVLESSHLTPLLIFMSDGANADGDVTSEMQDLLSSWPRLLCHTVFFGQGGSDRLKTMAQSGNGEYHLSVDGVSLDSTFQAIACKKVAAV